MLKEIGQHVMLQLLLYENVVTVQIKQLYMKVAVTLMYTFSLRITTDDNNKLT